MLSLIIARIPLKSYYNQEIKNRRLNYVLVIARCRVQYEKYFSSSFCFRNISRAESE